MDTKRVDICYRPLKIAWVMASNDRESFDYAVRASITLRGGRYNPIVLADQPEAARIVELYRADMLITLGDSPSVAALAAKFSHLINPLHSGGIFPKPGQGKVAHILDLENSLTHWRDTAEWNRLSGILRRFSWDDDDPLAGFFQIHCGAYPTPDQVHVDYAKMLSDVGPNKLANIEIDKRGQISASFVQNPSFAFLARHDTRSHHSVRASWRHDGFYVGAADSIIDLANYWNLRAADLSLMFYDPRHAERYVNIIPEFQDRLTSAIANLPEPENRLAVWSRPERLAETATMFPALEAFRCPYDEGILNGLNLQVPTIILGQETALGIVTRERGSTPRVSFSFREKPFHDDPWFYSQHLVASISASHYRHQDPEHVFQPPYVPELNEFYGRELHFRHDRVRIEPGRVGIIINATDKDEFIRGVPATMIAQRILELGGINAQPSTAGLVTRQLIARMGGIDDTRAFKIPGVRRLIKTHGPDSSFTIKEALRLIGGPDPENPSAKFTDQKYLHIEARAPGSDLTPKAVFAHLVERGLYRLGADLVCPVCTLKSWVPLDQLQHRVNCTLCGDSYDATRQLVGADCRYRRSGVLGLEKNALGAVPVALLLQQLSVFLGPYAGDQIFLPAMDFTSATNPMEKCETDFVIIVPQSYSDKTEIIIGEAKDRGGHITDDDVANMRRVADSMPGERFSTRILFSKLAPFSDDEITRIRALNGKYQHRVIMLTERELEPYYLYERLKRDLGIEPQYGVEGLAKTTSAIYFKNS